MPDTCRTTDVLLPVNKAASLIDIHNRVEVHVTADPGQDHKHLNASKATQIVNQLVG